MPEQPAAPRRDPRLDRSRTAILAAAVALLSEGGVRAVTIEAVTARSGVARSTLYRHFTTGTELLAAAFRELLPALPPAPEGGAPRDRLLHLVRAHADQFEQAPALAAVVWMTAIGKSADLPSDAEERTRLATLREHVIEHYRAPFEEVLTACLPGATLSGHEVELAAAQLAGPLLFNTLVTRRASDARFCARLVDDFLAGRARTTGEETARAQTPAT
ncbi:TetR/AcrR family transcriptional regulator [Amycolatopsis jiangsuensis]|uniref:AcrR family transcriptional regulator n=1 Tax=Amycolatopsis jiangsuensis TaxID=1181879 RepID=A0A840IT50_9PSEU|nr:TetR/AcrR family transcriptional regulator [Amycolatopsis jiangsuensis]MBB4684154.1 AcrR family transcriptional regulator [Amycolatopsis jiangsuensis]